MRDGGKGDKQRPIADREQFSNNWDKIFKAQEHQSPIQTKYGALYYETPYRGESTCESCDGSCGYIRGTKHESPCQDAHIEQQK